MERKASRNHEKIFSRIEFRQKVLQLLLQYFKYAFTSFVNKRRLYPENAFGTTQIFNVEVPVRQIVSGLNENTHK